MVVWPVDHLMRNLTLYHKLISWSSVSSVEQHGLIKQIREYWTQNTNAEVPCRVIYGKVAIESYHKEQKLSKPTIFL